MRRLAVLLILATAATPSLGEDVTVFAAASLKPALDTIAADFEATTGHDVQISYAGSNALAMQIIEGAPADIFISAAVNWMDEVKKVGLIVPDTRRDLLGNRLVLIAHGAAPDVTLTPGVDLAALVGDGRLAMAMVDAVPAGQYGKAALETLGAWTSVEPLVVQSENVRAALGLVATGEAAFGIVYSSDVVGTVGVSVAGQFPEDSHPPIRYPAALLTGAADAADRAFFEALSAPAAKEIFVNQGFLLLD